jgi:hypothetical protein
MKVLEKNRIKEYDDVTGQLISDREATLEDLLDILANNYIIQITIDVTKGTGQGQFKKKS